MSEPFDRAPFGDPQSPDPSSICDLAEEMIRARIKFPNSPEQRRKLYGALSEEFLELTRAIMDDEGLARVRAEVLQVACVAMRIYEELTEAEL